MNPLAPSRPSVGYRLALALLVTIAVAKPILIDTLDPDCFWHLRVAGDLMRQGIGPLVDDLSFNSIREPWTPYSWLAELGMAGVWHLAGWRGAVIAHAAMSAAFVLLLAAGCREMQRAVSDANKGSVVSGQGPVDETGRGEFNSILAVAAGCLWSLAYLSFRPATLAIDLLALAGWQILRDRRLAQRSRAVWWLVPLTVVLTNIHLTAMLVPLWLAALYVEALFRSTQRTPTDDGTRASFLSAFRIHHSEFAARYGQLTIACTLALLATPMLPGMIATAARYQTQDVMVASPILGEMRPFYDGAFGKVALGLVAITLVGCWRNRRQITPGEWLWLIGMLVFLFRLGRFAPLFAIVGSPMLAAFGPRLSDRPLRRRPIAVALAGLLALCVLRIAANLPGPGDTLDRWLNRNVPAANGYPTAAAAYVESRVSPTHGRMINEFNWGGYLEWRLGDRYQTFMDGRTQMYPPQFFLDAFYGTPDARRAMVDHTDADVAVLPQRGSCFRDALTQLGWTVAWEDDQSLVMLPAGSVARIDP